MSELHVNPASAVGGKRVLISGAGGSIGSEIARLVCSGAPKAVILLGHSELPLYTIERSLRDRFPSVPVFTRLGDVRDPSRMDYVCGVFGPDIVIHAAAIKHVPMAEANPNEAILTNVEGTHNLLAAAVLYKADDFILISTDKAVYPSCVMGATKRLAEHIVTSETDIRTSVVRFGNVLNTTGSVLPLFKSQILAGGPVTITHPDMERFFMSAEDAAAFVLATLTIENGDRLFVLDMGKPVKITDMANQLMEKMGKRVPIQYTGLRPGEKLTESLSYEDERLMHSREPGILQGRPMPAPANLRQQVFALCGKAEDGDLEALQLLKQLLPEFAHA